MKSFLFSKKSALISIALLGNAAYGVTVNNLFSPSAENSVGCTVIIGNSPSGSKTVTSTRVTPYSDANCVTAISGGQRNVGATPAATFSSGTTRRCNAASLYAILAIAGGTPTNARSVFIEPLDGVNPIWGGTGGACFNVSCTLGSPNQCTSADVGNVANAS